MINRKKKYRNGHQKQQKNIKRETYRVEIRDKGKQQGCVYKKQVFYWFICNNCRNSQEEHLKGT